MSGGAVEIEIKLRLRDAGGARRQLAALRARFRGRVHQRDVLFDTPDGALKRSGRLIRVRQVERVGPRDRGLLDSSPSRNARASASALIEELQFLCSNLLRPSTRKYGLLTFKGPGRAGRHKERPEAQIVIEDWEGAGDILAGLGFRPWFCYEKYRTRFRLPGLASLAVELDETPIGVFFELEGPPEAIDRAASLLGFGPADYITASYYDLFVAEHRRLGLPANAMLFPASA
jgi:adenylate cyclase class IV